VVRGHGDLHLRNLVWQDGAPLLFDAIEFSDLFAVCDRLYDLAFAPMDAWCHGQHDAANAMLNGWLAVTGDHDGLDLLPLFLALRAMIRVHAAASEGDLAAAARYLDAAFGFLAPAPPSLMAVGGLSGSGKSYRAHRLAPGLGAAPGAVVLRSDAIRKELAGVPADERLPPEAYTVEAGEIVYAELRARAADCLARGRAVIADAVHARSEQRAAIEAVARAAGVPFIGEWLTVAPDVAAARLDARRGDVSDGDRRVLNQQLTYDLGEITWRSLDATA
jgi:predicted kinase